MRRIMILVMAAVTALLAAAATGCGGAQPKPDREQIQRRSDKAFHDLEREEVEQETE